MSKLLTDLNKLKNAQQYLEKNENAVIDQLSYIDCRSQLNELYSDITNSSKILKNKLQNDIKDIVIPLRKVKHLLKQDLENIDMSSMKKDMTKIQKNIQSVDSYTKLHLETLQQEEDKLCEEIKVFEKKMQEWSKPIKSNFPKSPISKRISTSVTGNVPQEVTDFSEYITASGGHEQGWTTEDHALFLKARMKTKNVEHLAEMLHMILPVITAEEIIEHENWYKKYLELKEKQKIAIQNWREQKSKMKRRTIPQRPKNNQVSVSNDMYKKEELQHKLSLWKAEKRAKMKNEFQQKHQELLRKKEQEKQKKLRQQQIKKEVDYWKQVKVEAKKAEQLQKEIAEQQEKESRAAKANKLIREYQKQDENFLQRKLHLRFSQSKGSDAVKVNHVEAPRDLNRLLKLTKQWILRTYGSDESGTVDNKLSLQAIPKLGIPEWRKSII